MNGADSIAVSGGVLDRLGALGVDIAAVLSRLGLARAQFEPHRRVSTEVFFRLWRTIEAVASATLPPRQVVELGLRLGVQRMPAQTSVASAAAFAAANLAEGLDRMARYKRLVCPEQVHIEVAGGEVGVRFHWILAEGAAPRLLVDSTLSSLAALAREGTGGRVRPRRVELARERHDVERFESHFGVRVRWRAPHDRLVFDAAALAVPFVTHDPAAFRALLPHLEEALAARAEGASFVDDVRLAIGRRLCGERPSVEKIARDLAVSPRTLQRRLDEAETRYQDLLDEVRARSARRLLASTSLEAAEVAFLLGFEEPNSFTRAFRTWQGTSPSRWRAQSAEVWFDRPHGVTR